METYWNGDTIHVKGDEYELTLDPSLGPRAQLKLRGALVADLFLPSSCSAGGQIDVLLDVDSPLVYHGSGSLIIELPARSSLWARKTYVLECFPDRVEHFFRLGGRGAIDSCLFFAGHMQADGEPEMSTPCFTRLFNPEPNADREQYSPPSEPSLIGVRSDRSHHRGNWFFTPAPFCYCLELANGQWLSVGIAAKPEELDFASFEYMAGAGFGLRLSYEGQLEVMGNWESPHLVFQSAAGEYEALRNYCDFLFRSGLAPTNRTEQFDWWNEPIFCGWGQQVNMAARAYYDGAELATRAATYATQYGYERFLDRIEARGLHPGIVVVDDKWQSHYGLNWPDQNKWPYMESFVSLQHQLGRKVLLWLKAWDPEGIPFEECLLDEDGLAVAVDPSCPEYELRLRAQVRALLREMDVDGFKIDFTHKLPSAKLSQKPCCLWGVRLLKKYLQTIYEEAKLVKPDALIIAHTANPFFADVVDMIRLNDVANLEGDESYLASMEHRAKVARSAAPHWLIDTDNWPSPSRKAWREYIEAQPNIGVPSLYYVSGISYLEGNGRLRQESFDDSDYEALAKAWKEYRRNGCREKGGYERAAR